MTKMGGELKWIQEKEKAKIKLLTKSMVQLEEKYLRQVRRSKVRMMKLKFANHWYRIDVGEQLLVEEVDNRYLSVPKVTHSTRWKPLML